MGIQKDKVRQDSNLESAIKSTQEVPRLAVPRIVVLKLEVQNPNPPLTLRRLLT